MVGARFQPLARRPTPLLLVDPSTYRVPVSVPPGECQANAVRRVAQLLSQTTGKLNTALRALVWRLSVHPSQEVGELRYTELSPGYVARAAGCCRETARQAWHMLRPILGWGSMPVSRVRSLGLSVRRRAAGGSWGQHLLLTARCVATVDALVAMLGLGEVHQGKPGSAWMVVDPLRKGAQIVAKCPWHDDKRPSMLLNSNDDGVSGSAVCLACGVRAYWRSWEGITYTRKARCQLPNQGTGTIHNHGAQPRGAVGHVLAHLVGAGMRRSGSRIPDLLDLLGHAERMSKGQKAADAAWAAEARGVGPGDRYVSVDPMVPVAWRRISTTRGEVQVPSRWEPAEVRWVLADLDAFDGAPGGDRGLVLAGQALERWARSHPGLTGRIGVVRTSHRGVQVIAELSEPAPDARRWHRSPAGRGLCTALDIAALAACRAVGFVGGHADQAVHAGGRLMRRPGHRLSKDGVLCRARLAHRSGPVPANVVQ